MPITRASGDGHACDLPAAEGYRPDVIVVCGDCGQQWERKTEGPVPYWVRSSAVGDAEPRNSSSF